MYNDYSSNDYIKKEYNYFSLTEIIEKSTKVLINIVTHFKNLQEHYPNTSILTDAETKIEQLCNIIELDNIYRLVNNI